jgi:heme/copper-type cytochrome/quinol oxidase subunit 4
MKYLLSSLIVILHMVAFMWIDSNEMIQNRTASFMFYISTLIPVAIVGSMILGSDNNKPET